MDADSLRQAVLQAGPSALGISFLTGFLFSFNPVALASIPVALAYVTKARTPRQSRVFAGMFIAGLVLTHVVLGGAAGLGGQGLEALLGRYWGLVLGPWLILLGLLWPGWICLPFKGLSFRVTRATGVWGAFALGVPFAVAACPVCPPAMIVLLGGRRRQRLRGLGRRPRPISAQGAGSNHDQFFLQWRGITRRKLPSALV